MKQVVQCVLQTLVIALGAGLGIWGDRKFAQFLCFA